jgi:hypothetical protein
MILLKTRTSTVLSHSIEELEDMIKIEPLNIDSIRSLVHFNYLLYFSNEEENALSFGQCGTYFLSLERGERLDFCGLWSIFAILRQAKEI